MADMFTVIIYNIFGIVSFWDQGYNPDCQKQQTIKLQVPKYSSVSASWLVNVQTDYLAAVIAETQMESTEDISVADTHTNESKLLIVQC